MDKDSELQQTVDPIVEFRSAEKRFGEVVVLDSLDLAVKRGESVVILGPSGCGKTTLLRCTNGLEGIDSGSIVVNGTDLTKPGVDLPLIRRSTGMVFQQFSLFPHMTIMENLCIGPRRLLKQSKEETRERAYELLKKVGVADKKDQRPRNLSGGQQQRVAIARALMMDPKVMLFDEVTSALDPELVSEVLNVMADLAGSGMTLLIVTHEISFARKIADRIIFMEHGRIVEQGTPENLLDNPEVDRTQRFLGKLIH